MCDTWSENILSLLVKTSKTKEVHTLTADAMVLIGKQGDLCKSIDEIL